jgi:hydrogenase maturation protease
VQRTLVLGVGNTLLGDEGAGVHALAYLRQQPVSRLLELVDAGTASFTLLPIVAEHARLIVLDAAKLAAPPGTVRVFEGVAMDNLLNRPRRSVHEVGICDLLQLARLSGRLPERRALVGIQPAMIDWQDGPSPVVEAAFEEIAAAVWRLVANWHAPAGAEAA